MGKISYQARAMFINGETDLMLEIPISSFTVKGGTSMNIDLNSTNDTKILAELGQAKTQKNIEIRGSQAAWKNKWTAAGVDVLWNMVHYDVQLIGGAVLHSGKISEMATGEGKTLVSTLPVFLNA